MRQLGLACLALGLTLAGCDRLPTGKEPRAGQAAAPKANVTATLNEPLAPGTTPMGERVAVLGLLNKRNSISRDLTMKPGQALRVDDDVIVRLKACERTPPWEFDQLTGAFVQVDVQQPGGGWKRVFSGWLYKESPSLNVVEHPVYDVWPKSCAMNFPAAAEDAGSPEDDSSPSNDSQADGSADDRSSATPSN
ncbi:hypothetical protein GCM10022280_23150 [Sphingomonas swuensis]|uniref:DUF2155 domain-containing protein n=1 Tax=Sphingomonas swuensis TaxID=977800 RepID=A0ABP7T6V1_9SPHN